MATFPRGGRVTTPSTVTRTKTLTSCIMISFCDNVASRPLCCTRSRFCQRLNERALFLSCSWTTGGDVMVDPAASTPLLEPAGRFSRCRLCSISCCLDVSRYSWYRTAREAKETSGMSFTALPEVATLGPVERWMECGGQMWHLLGRPLDPGLHVAQIRHHHHLLPSQTWTSTFWQPTTAHLSLFTFHNHLMCNYTTRIYNHLHLDISIFHKRVHVFSIFVK